MKKPPSAVRATASTLQNLRMALTTPIKAPPAMKPEAIILSPGPGRPETAGIMPELIVAAARIVNDRETGRPKGFGFVEMPNDAEAKAAIEALNGNDIGGPKAVVNEARPREARPPRKEW